MRVGDGGRGGGTTIPLILCNAGKIEVTFPWDSVTFISN